MSASAIMAMFSGADALGAFLGGVVGDWAAVSCKILVFYNVAIGLLFRSIVYYLLLGCIPEVFLITP